MDKEYLPGIILIFVVFFLFGSWLGYIQGHSDGRRYEQNQQKQQLNYQICVNRGVLSVFDCAALYLKGE